MTLKKMLRITQRIRAGKESKRQPLMVDNFLKTVKRKLSQAESFRDGTWAGVLLRGMANINFQDEVLGVRTEDPVFMPKMTGAQYEKRSRLTCATTRTT